MPTYDEDDVRDYRGRGHGREDDLDGPPRRRCSECPREVKDHTIPMAKDCARAAAVRQGLPRWMADAIEAVTL